jgi:hypothetical protein
VLNLASDDDKTISARRQVRARQRGEIAFHPNNNFKRENLLHIT